jgi:dissimilatory sulfite reductase related protein
VQVAEFDGVAPLTDTHWKVIHHIRERFFRVGGVPAMRLVCRATGLSKPHLQHLFGGCRTIWRIAGLPNPGEEAKAYF